MLSTRNLKRGLATPAGLMLITAAALCGALCSWEPSDAFSGTAIDTSKWNVTSPLGGSTVTQDDALSVASDGTVGNFADTPCGFSDTPGLFGPGAGVGTRYKFHGDFDIQVSFSAFSGLPSDPEFTQAFLNVYQDDLNQIHIKRISGNWVDGIQTVYMLGGYVVSPSVTGFGGDSGRFRVVREGGTITTYFDPGTGFEPQFSQSGMFTGDVLVSLIVGREAGMPSSVVWDNFISNPSNVVVQAPLQFEGFLFPINDPATPESVFKHGKVVPVRFHLVDCNGMPFGAATATISLVEIGDSGESPVNEADYTMPADTGSTFRFDESTNQYIYNLGTRRLTAGKQYRITATIAETGQTHSVTISLK